MRFAGEAFTTEESNPAIASSYDDFVRQREEAKTLYKMIMQGELGNPAQHQETLRKLQDQISGVGLRGV
jgi:hypothetical protein